MQFIRNSLFTRSDTLLGVCEALGQDLGVSPTWFRVAVAALVIYNLQLALAVYLGLGVIVLLSRLLYRSATKEAAEIETQAADEAAAPVEAPAAQPAMVLAEAA